MNRLDRLTAILIQLQGKRVVKAQDIADRFEISLRTVYRDIKSLGEAGVPVAGESGIGYRLMEGYRLPPVMFTKEEASSFITAEKLVTKFTDKSTALSYAEALHKVKAILRMTEKDYLEELEPSIAVIENSALPPPAEQLHLQGILDAIVKKAVIDIGYCALNSEEHSNRHIESVGIFYLGRFWYLIAFCRLRKDYRHFRTDRISYLRDTGLKYNQQHPSLQTFIDKTGKEKELFNIIIRVDKDVVKYFGDQKYYNGFIKQEEAGNQVEMHFLTSSLTGFAKFFLLFGAHADLVSPPELQSIVKKELNGIGKRLSNQY